MVDLGVMGVIGLPPTLLALKAREKLTPPLRGGAQETCVLGCCRREGFAAVAVVCVAHLKTKNKIN